MLYLYVGGESQLYTPLPLASRSGVQGPGSKHFRTPGKEDRIIPRQKVASVIGHSSWLILSGSSHLSSLKRHTPLHLIWVVQSFFFSLFIISIPDPKRKVLGLTCERKQLLWMNKPSTRALRCYCCIQQPLCDFATVSPPHHTAQKGRSLCSHSV